MLIETVAGRQRGGMAVVGVGLNIEPLPAAHAAREPGDRPAAAPRSTRRATARPQCCSASRCRSCARCCSSSATASTALPARFARRDVLRGRPVRCSATPATALDGTADGVAPTARCGCATLPARCMTTSSGEVSVRLAEPG